MHGPCPGRKGNPNHRPAWGRADVSGLRSAACAGPGAAFTFPLRMTAAVALVFTLVAAAMMAIAAGLC
jgi:hypothetical protein